MTIKKQSTSYKPKSLDAVETLSTCITEYDALSAAYEELLQKYVDLELSYEERGQVVDLYHSLYKEATKKSEQLTDLDVEPICIQNGFFEDALVVKSQGKEYLIPIGKEATLNEIE